MPAKKHRVELTEVERTYLIELTTRGTYSARKQTRARIPLEGRRGSPGPSLDRRAHQ